MRFVETSMAVMLSMAGATAHAQASLSFGAEAWDNVHNVFEMKEHLPAVVNGSFLSTGGTVTAIAPSPPGYLVHSSVNAIANPTTGMFKAKSTATIQAVGPEQAHIASAGARFDLADSIVFSGPGSSVNVSFTMSYDTDFSGLGFAFPRTDLTNHHQMLNSRRGLSLSYSKLNPSYDPGATCTDYGSDGVYCPPETQKYITHTDSDGNYMFGGWAMSDWWMSDGGNTIYSYAGSTDNGHYTGQVVMSLILPTNQAISLNYFADSSAMCWHFRDCALVSDASHSDYLGMTLESGASFTSVNGYQYLGLAAAVPEPESYALFLAGFGLMASVVRRRKKTAR